MVVTVVPWGALGSEGVASAVPCLWLSISPMWGLPSSSGCAPTCGQPSVLIPWAGGGLGQSMRAAEEGLSPEKPNCQADNHFWSYLQGGCWPDHQNITDYLH